MKNTVVVIFSKDRAMQLQATIDSFYCRCSDNVSLNVVVLYKVSDERHRNQYNQLIKKYNSVKFVEEEADLVMQVFDQCLLYKFVMFVVDDTIFVADFEISTVERYLNEHGTAIGFSLRLGINVNYCYALNRPQKTPCLRGVGSSILIYRWPGAECDWGYPLEVSSSIYRTEEIIPIIRGGLRGNPGNIEGSMATKCNVFSLSHPFLLCYHTSRAFSTPINIVRPTKLNRAGNKEEYSVDELSKKFEEGFKIDVVSGFNALRLDGVHQEVDLPFIKSLEI